jgi:predicted esterase YcpF (UPF0227 family)
MNVLYLHGLESKLSNKKRAILERYAHVTAPDLDYKSNPNMIEYLYNIYHNQKIDVIIGSSMGGFSGYYLSNLLGVSSLLYNPALPYRNEIEQIVPKHLPYNYPVSMRILLGGLDTVIKATDNLFFLSQNISDKTDYTIVMKQDLEHQIPIAVFEEQTKVFFESLKNNHNNK